MLGEELGFRLCGRLGLWAGVEFQEFGKPGPCTIECDVGLFLLGFFADVDDLPVANVGCSQGEG